MCPACLAAAALIAGSAASTVGLAALVVLKVRPKTVGPTNKSKEETNGQ